MNRLLTRLGPSDIDFNMTFVKRHEDETYKGEAALEVKFKQLQMMGTHFVVL